MKPIKTKLSQQQLAGFASSYLNEGRKQESWELVSVDIDGKLLEAHIRMRSRYISPTDPDGFHLTIFSTLEFLSQLTIIHAHVLAGYTQKTREGWMVESSIKSKQAVRDPENIRVRMEVASFRTFKHHIIATTKSRVYDEQGSFEATLKGFLS